MFTYKVYFDAEPNCVVMEWNVYSTSEEFRQGTEVMLNTLIAHKATCVLADIKKYGADRKRRQGVIGKRISSARI